MGRRLSSNQGNCHIPNMAKHPKRPRDPAQLAKLIVDIATREVSDEKQAPATGDGGRAQLHGLRACRPSDDPRLRRKAAKLRWAARSK